MHLSHKILISSLALGAFAFPKLSTASSAAPFDDDDETPLAQHMHVVEDGLRALRRSLRDPATYPEALATVVECQAAALASKGEIPAMAARVPEGERDAFVKGYRKEMIAVIEGFLKLERGLLEGQDPDALKEIYGAIKGLEDPGHERYTEDG